MRVLLGQLQPQPGDPTANTKTIQAAIANHPDTELAVFPELFLTGYELDRMRELAIEPTDPLLAGIAESAQSAGTSVVVGFAERTEEGVANAVACIGPRSSIYRKSHLFGPAERSVFDAGDRLLVADLAGRRAGVLVCFDAEFPEPARALSVAGAELLVTVAANMEPYGAEQELAVRARALDNRRPHVYVNRVGSEQGLRFVGGSCVVAPDGTVEERLGAEAELRCVDVEIGAPAQAEVDYLSQRRTLAVDSAQRSLDANDLEPAQP